jgi:hypothetical protein
MWPMGWPDENSGESVEILIGCSNAISTKRSERPETQFRIMFKDTQHHMLVNRAELGEIAKQGQFEFNEGTHTSGESDQNVRSDGKYSEFK